MYRYKVGFLKKVKASLKRGGVVAYPTEFCYGLGCDPRNYKAINKILKLKVRNKDKGLIVIAGEETQLIRLINTDLNEKSKYKKYWPGANTLLLPLKRKNVRYNLSGRHTKLAVRVTAHEQVQQLCAYLNMALVSTSANKAGCKPIKTHRDCIKQFAAKGVLVLNGITNFAKHPSAIIDFATQKQFR